MRLRTVRASIGWNPAALTGDEDLDLEALEVRADGNVPSDDHLVFFNNQSSPDGAVRLTGVPDGGDDRTRQRIDVHLDAVDADIDRIVLMVSSYNELIPFAQVTAAFLAIESDAESLAYYDLTRIAEGHAFVWGEVYRDDGEWRLRATGIGYRGLKEALAAHGVR